MARQPLAGVGARPIAHLSLVDRVTDELHRAILHGDIAPGATVSIVELCERFDVSHIPVREALRRLESEGLISLRPSRSAVVASLSVEDLTDIYRLRKLVEGDLVVRAVAELGPGQLARAEDELAVPAVADHAFHTVMLENVLGPTDRRILDVLWRAADRYFHILIADLARTRADRVEAHRHLLDLARAGQAEELRDAWVSHLESDEARLRAALSQRTTVEETS
ncbi:GntR family transcriptional regulator [Nocardioides sp. CN2-186]|uniref:GntR family transcriptional regulator n=1 Tax=Nocardioides tweenelious TaxID=3156607 RepID=UPI0032B4858E